MNDPGARSPKRATRPSRRLLRALAPGAAVTLGRVLAVATFGLAALVSAAAVLTSAAALPPGSHTFVELEMAGLGALGGLLRLVVAQVNRSGSATGSDACGTWIGGSVIFLGLFIMAAAAGSPWRPTLLTWSLILALSVPVQRRVLSGKPSSARSLCQSTVVGWLLLSMTAALIFEPVGWKPLPGFDRFALGVLSLPATAISLWPLFARALRQRRQEPVVDLDICDPWGTLEGWLLFGAVGWLMGAQLGVALYVGVTSFGAAMAATVVWTRAVKAQKVHWATGPLIPAVILAAVILGLGEVQLGRLGRLPVVNLTNPSARFYDYVGAAALELFALSLAHRWFRMVRPRAGRRAPQTP